MPAGLSCWDEPDFKAVFATTLIIDSALTAVSNATIASETLVGGEEDRLLRRFDQDVHLISLHSL